MDRLSEKKFLKAFGKNLRRLRREKGWTQEELANEIGIEISQISRIERGLINTTLLTLVKIAEALRVEIEILFES